MIASGDSDGGSARWAGDTPVACPAESADFAEGAEAPREGARVGRRTAEPSADPGTVEADETRRPIDRPRFVRLRRARIPSL